MQRSQPLPDSNPEFSIFACSEYREYRVENWHLARDGSGRVIRGTSLWTWKEAIIPVIVALTWSKVRANYFALMGLCLISMFIICTKCTQVLFESVIVLPPQGIQFETHRGLPSLPLSVSRRFIPMTALQDFIINEGIRRWDVRYYLAAIKRSRMGHLTLDVAYENILPHFPVLAEVYRGVHESLLAPVTDVQDKRSYTTRPK